MLYPLILSRGVHFSETEQTTKQKPIAVNDLQILEQGNTCYLMEKEVSITTLRDQRTKYKITQRELATKVGVSKQYLTMIENGKRPLSEELRQSLQQAIDELHLIKSACRLEVMIDYVRLHFMTKDVRRVVEDALRFPFEDMIREERGFYGFDATYRFGDLYIMQGAADSEELYTLLELKGRGCRMFECHMEALGWTWFDFFQHCLDNFSVRVKRLDLAIDDVDGILSIADLKRKCRIGEWESSWMKSYSGYESGQRLRNEEQDKRELMGETLYLGSLSSEIYFCAYEKDYEQYKKQGIPIEDAPVKNRFEIRLKNDRAYKAMEDLVFRRDVDSTIFEIVNRYTAFVDYVNGEQIISPRWQKFMGDGRSELRLTMKPEPYTVERTKKWFQKQVAPSLNLLLALDDMEDTSFVPDSLGCAAMSEKHVRVLKQVAKFREQKTE